MKKSRLTLIVSILLILIAAGVSILVRNKESIEESTPINGRVNIDGYGLNVKVEGSGTPVVIFESGLGGGISSWANIQPEISKITRTFSYDRAGIGSSDKSTLPRTSLNQVSELHNLLKNTKVKGPYIIVAHSIGGFNARLFTDNYKEEVAGIVFVDAAHEEMFNLYKFIAPSEYEKTKAEFVNPEGTFQELLTSAGEVRKSRKNDALRNIPITVLSAEKVSFDVEGNLLVAWTELQKDLGTLSNISRQKTVDNSGHMIQDDNPQVIIDSIKEMINEVNHIKKNKVAK